MTAKRIGSMMLATMGVLLTGCDDSVRQTVYAGLETGAQSILSALVTAIFSMVG